LALSIDTQDLVNYPGTTKRVSIDVASIVPIVYEGDEKIVLYVSTTAYSDNTARTSIQNIYITDMKAGWCKSSGFVGTNGKFNIDSTHNRLKVKMDNTVSGTDGYGYYEIVLDYNVDETPVRGEVVAADMEAKIKDLTMVAADTGYALSYKNCDVSYQDGKFYIVSGSMGSNYTGANRSSVRVSDATSSGCAVELGFDLDMNSEELSSISVREAIVSSTYTAGTTPLFIGAGTSVDPGDALMITDGTNTDYFTALSGTIDTQVVVATTSGGNGFDGISNSYTANEAKVQILREQDPEGYPTMIHTDVDSVARWAIKSLINQIDYSS